MLADEPVTTDRGGHGGTCRPGLSGATRRAGRHRSGPTGRTMGTMTTTAPTRPAPRSAPPAEGAGMLPDGWLRGLVSGVEAAVLGWLTLVVPALAAYVGTAAAPALGEASWQSAAGAGTALWLLGHGGDMTAGSGVVSVVPLGITLLSLGIVYATVRRGGTTGYAAGSFAVLGYVLTMLVVSVLAPGGRW